MWIIIVIVGLLLGIFAFSQIIYSLFCAWPKAKTLEREGKLVKPIPISTFILAPVVWGILVAGSIWIMNKFFSEYTLIYCIVLGFTLVIVVAQIPRRNKDIEADFKDTWGRFLKEEE